MRTWREVRNFAWHRFARSNRAKLHKSWECAQSRSTRENFQFFLCIEVQLTLPFPLLRHYQMPECFYVNNCCFWARATVLSCYRIW